MNRPPRGTGLVELMVAMVIGLFLILGAVTVYIQSRQSYRTIEAVARVQEKARYALEVLEADIRSANYWGLNNWADSIGVDRTADPTKATLQALDEVAVVIDKCHVDWVLDLREYVGGSDDSADAIDDCPPAVGDFQDGSDVLVIRRAGNAALAGATALQADGLYLQTSRIKGAVFSPNRDGNPAVEANLPSDFQPELSETHDLSVLGYYVSDASTGNARQPSLRRKRLVNGDTGASILDEEIMHGIEDLQVQFGLDTDANGDANADLFVNPGDGAIAGGAIVAVRIWLRVRADEPDFSFFDATDYQYASMADAAVISDADRRFRRVLVHKTIQLRNTRGHDDT
jgi:type IV pilus assembly protein PilW